jgi:hypothetical protein
MNQPREAPVEEATRPSGFARWELRSIPTKRLMAQTRPGWAERTERIRSNPGFGLHQKVLADADAGRAPAPLVICVDEGPDTAPRCLVGSEWIVAAQHLDIKRVSVILVDKTDEPLVQGHLSRTSRPQPEAVDYYSDPDEDDPAFLSR